MVPMPVKRLDLGLIRAQLSEMGPMGRTEKEILIVLGVTGAFWV